MTVGEKDDRLEEIIGRLEEIKNIPTIPAVAFKAMEAARNPASSMRDIADIISVDPPLAARVLKIVNSAYYGLKQGVGSLPLALTILGMREIINIVMSISVMTLFPDNTVKGGFDRMKFWKHCASCAQASKAISDMLGLKKSSSDAFVGGLLHDVGKIIMDEFLHEDYNHALRLSIQETIPEYDAEGMTIGVTHPQIGAWLARKWRLPEPLALAILRHHAGEKIDLVDGMQQAVYVANQFCLAIESGREKQEIAQLIQNDPVWNLSLKNTGRNVSAQKAVETLITETGKTTFLIS